MDVNEIGHLHLTRLLLLYCTAIFKFEYTGKCMVHHVHIPDESRKHYVTLDAVDNHIFSSF